MATREGRRVQAGRHASAGDGATAGDHAGEGPEGQMAGLSRRFPPRPARDGGWPATSQRRGHVLARLFAPPFTAGRDKLQSSRRIGLTKLVHWLEEQPGRTWQDRWVASGADAAGNLAWRELAASWLRSTGWASGNPRTDFIALGRGVLPLICGDVIRPSLPWLLTPAIPKNLAAEMARSRDPAGFAALAALARTDPASAATKDLAARRVAAILAAKGGAISGITVGDCLELLDVLAAGGGNTSPYFYQLLHALGTFPPAAPPTVRAFKTPGQLTVEQLVDRYPITCQAGPRPDHRLPAGTPAGGRPCDAAEPVPHPGRPVLARPGAAPSRDRLAAAGPGCGRGVETAGHRQDGPGGGPCRAGHPDAGAAA